MDKLQRRNMPLRYLMLFFDIQYGITPLFEDITPIMDGETTCLYQIRYQNGEWCIISADMSIDPILAYGLSNIDENDEPEGFTDLVKWYTNQIAENISNLPPLQKQILYGNQFFLLPETTFAIIQQKTHCWI